MRARGEHIFRVMKCLCGLTKVCDRGLMKNTTRVLATSALASLYRVRHRLVRQGTYVGANGTDRENQPNSGAAAMTRTHAALAARTYKHRLRICAHIRLRHDLVRGSLVPPHHPDDHPLNGDVVLVHVHRRHGLVGRL